MTFNEHAFVSVDLKGIKFLVSMQYVGISSTFIFLYRIECLEVCMYCYVYSKNSLQRPQYTKIIKKNVVLDTNCRAKSHMKLKNLSIKKATRKFLEVCCCNTTVIFKSFPEKHTSCFIKDRMTSLLYFRRVLFYNGVIHALVAAGPF